MEAAYKVKLNNRVKGRAKLDYILIEQSGPTHAPTFLYEVQIGGTMYGRGTGPTKAAAKEDAARNAVAFGDETGKFRKL